MERALLVPVKDLCNAKHRLAPILEPDERRELAWLMLTKVLHVASGLPLRKVIVTSYEPAKRLGEELGFDVLSEARQSSESESVDQASAQLERSGVKGVLRVPLDLPLIVRQDLERILAFANDGYPAVLVPSFDGTGTNALYREPPTLFPSRFGPNSLALHRQHAREVDASFIVKELPSLALDIDTAEDLEAFLNTGKKSPLRDYLIRIGVPDRLPAKAPSGGWEPSGTQNR